jgi:pyrroloquinoline quinone biosynthesis protein D
MSKPTCVRLSPKARLRWDPWEEKYVLLYPERGLVLNGAAHAVLALCDGMRSPDEMAVLIAQRFAIEDTERVRGAVSAFLVRLEKLGLLETDPGGLA